MTRRRCVSNRGEGGVWPLRADSRKESVVGVDYSAEFVLGILADLC